MSFMGNEFLLTYNNVIVIVKILQHRLFSCLIFPQKKYDVNSPGDYTSFVCMQINFRTFVCKINKLKSLEIEMLESHNI